MKRSGKGLSAELLKVSFLEGTREQGLRILAHMISRAYLRDQRCKHENKTELDKEGELS